MQDITKRQEIRLARWAQEVQQSTIQQLLAVATQPGILSFALGLPAAELFPVQAYAQAVEQLLLDHNQALQYGMPELSLKRHIVALMEQRGVRCHENQVFLTMGAQQAMSLLARLLLDLNGTVIVEEIVYSGILQAVEALQPALLTVPTHPESGMDVDAVEALLKGGQRPAFIYAISDGHNPLGISMSLEKRRHLVELARRYHVPILEDDAYGHLYYDDQPIPSMRSLDEEWVFYLGSFSKILAPALRTGWMIVPEHLISALSALKEGSDINTANLSQRSIAAYLDTGHLAGHVQTLRQAYRARRDVMVRAVQTYFPRDVRFSLPRSGMFLWVELPGKPDMEELLRIAIQREQVAFVPGHAFEVQGSCHAAHCMRLNFSNCGLEDIERGIARLGQILPA
ncbi:2-aminoadipate aminotransferase [Ktedonobacteria bacterium brp13]|nr:2-aminoadipate aminotransferase [Ktedonobacteria bacterium brp13]